MAAWLHHGESLPQRPSPRLTCVQEQAAAQQVPLERLQQLQAELLQAVAHTGSLEAQVQQLKQAAAAAAKEHADAVQQQAQDGALDAAEQVSAAVQAAAERHTQQAQALEAQLAEARQELEAARRKWTEVQQEQAARQQRMVDRGMQACSSATVQDAAVQTEATGPNAAAAELAWKQQQLSPSRGASACESPSGRCGSLGGSPSSVAQTAVQLQLELAKVKLTPLKPLVGACLPKRQASGGSGRLFSGPSRLGSALSELGGGCVPGVQCQPSGSWGDGGSGGGHMLAPAARCPLAELRCGFGSRQAGLGEEEDDAFATPLARTPASLSPGDLSPSGSMFALPDSRQQVAHGLPVPPLDLQRVRHSSLSCASDSSSARGAAPSLPPSSRGIGGSSSGSWGGLSAEASTSVGSLSSLGPSASQAACPWMPVSSRAASPLPERGGTAAGGSGNWQAARLDASLARLAALTAALTGHKT